MASAATTPNLNLPQWVGTEKPERTDFNAAFDAIDEFWKYIYPVGCLFETTDSAFNPQTHFGGTWEQYGAGRVTVGYSAGETEFNSGGKTGGAKTHTLTEAQMPNHQHDTINPPTWGSAYPTYPSILNDNVDNYQKLLGGAGGNNIATNAGIIKTGYKGGGQAHNNLQPYITVFWWRRTA